MCWPIISYIFLCKICWNACRLAYVFVLNLLHDSAFLFLSIMINYWINRLPLVKIASRLAQLVSIFLSVSPESRSDTVLVRFTNKECAVEQCAWNGIETHVLWIDALTNTPRKQIISGYKHCSYWLVFNHYQLAQARSKLDQVWSILPELGLLLLDCLCRSSFACGVTSWGGVTPMQAKWIKLDLIW